MKIDDYGWNEYFEGELLKIETDDVFPARIISDFGQNLKVICESGELLINTHVKTNKDYETGVGDWLALKKDNDIDEIYICGVLNRRTKFSRAASGSVIKEQIVAANIDTVFLMQSLDNDFNPRRMERYLIAAWESGAMPVVVLTKSDCCNDVEGKVSQIYNIAPGVDIVAVSNITGEGIENIKNYFKKGTTVALLGSSGVGKSTLVNTLAGKELLKTNEVRQNDSRGRHTTTHRELILLPDGGLILDTPGIRSLSIWESDKGLTNLFSDIEELAKSCRFNDCVHKNEPGCAVKEAIENGSLDIKRWDSYVKLQKELAHSTRKANRKRQEKQMDKRKDTTKNQKIYEEFI